MKNKFLGLVMAVIVIGLVVGLVMFNQWLQRQVGDITQQPPQTASEPAPVVAKQTKQKTSGEVIRKTRLAPERTFEVSVFYQGGEEIAQHKMTEQGEIYDQIGVIPNGKVQFVNESDETYGVEYYRDGLRHGPARVNYKGGQLKQEAQYQYGKLVASKEYYQDGTLRMDVNYSDARVYKDGREIGVGKVYARDGVLKYEWFLINSDPTGFRKSYNRYGELTSAIYYDEYGVEIPPKVPMDGSSAVPDANLPSQ